MKRFRFFAVVFLCSIVYAGMASLVCNAGTGGEISLQATSVDNLITAEPTCAEGDVIAANAGTVVMRAASSKFDGGMGNTVIIEHTLTDSKKIYSLYAHLASIDSKITVGRIIAKGVKVGIMGASGFGSPCYWQDTLGIHLHFEMKDKPVTHNPSGAGKHWLYTPSNADDFGYHDPNLYIGNILDRYSALDKNKKIVRFGHPSHTLQEAGCLYNETTCGESDLFHTGINYTSVNSTSFNEQFNEPTTSWNKDFGDWFLKDGFYSVKSDGKSSLSFVSTYNSTFSDFTFTVKMRRAGNKCNTCANRVVIRANGAVDTKGIFANAYHFQYTRDGYFSVYRYRKGDEGFFVNWKKSTAIKQGDAWNILKVVTNGPQLSFYINGTRVWIGKNDDSLLKAGLVGFGMFSDQPSQLFVDYATLQSQ